MNNEIELDEFIVLLCKRKNISLEKILSDGLHNPHDKNHQPDSSFKNKVMQPVK